MAGLRDKARSRANQMGPGVARLVQRFVAKEGVSRAAAIQTLERRGRIRRSGNSYVIAPSKLGKLKPK